MKSKICRDKAKDSVQRSAKSKMHVLSETSSGNAYRAEPTEHEFVQHINSVTITTDSVVATVVINYEPGTKAIIINWGDGTADAYDVSDNPIKAIKGLPTISVGGTDAPPQPENTILVQHIYPELPDAEAQLKEQELSTDVSKYKSAADLLTHLRTKAAYLVQTGFIADGPQVEVGPKKLIAIEPRYEFVLFPIVLGFKPRGYESVFDDQAEFDVDLLVAHEEEILKELTWRDLKIPQTQSGLPITDEREFNRYTVVELDGSGLSFEVSLSSLNAIPVLVAVKERDSSWKSIFDDAWKAFKHLTLVGLGYSVIEEIYTFVRDGGVQFDGSTNYDGLDPMKAVHRFGWHPAWAMGRHAYSDKINRYYFVDASVESGDGEVGVEYKILMRLIADVYRPTPDSSSTLSR